MASPTSAREYQYLPTPEGRQPVGSGPASATIKEEIEDAGLFGGITNRIKKSADTYINQKLDEIETRIDRKLDEIDRRLAEWRDKEVANRIKILKITLWASVIVGIVSLIYSYVKVNFPVGADKPVPKVVARRCCTPHHWPRSRRIHRSVGRRLSFSPHGCADPTIHLAMRGISVDGRSRVARMSPDTCLKDKRPCRPYNPSTRVSAAARTNTPRPPSRRHAH